MKTKSIATRIIFYTLPVITLSTVIFIAFSYLISNKQINTIINSTMQESLNSAGLLMRLELQKNAEVASSMARNTEVFDVDNMSFDQLRGYVKEFVIRGISSNPNTVGGGIWYEPHRVSNLKYYGPYVYMDQGKSVFVEDYSEKGTNNFHLADWYLNGKNANTPGIIWSGVYYDPIAKVIMVTATKPMYDKNGKFMGVTTADMALTDIRSIANSMSSGKTTKAVLFGAEGEFISFYRDPKDTEGKSLDNFDKDWKQVASYLHTHREGIYKFEEEGIEKRIYFRTIPEVNWSLGIVIDESEIDTNMLSRFLLLTIIPVVGLLLSIFSTISVARYLRRITKKVNTFADRAARGDFSRRISVKEEDEFGYMEERLNIMMSNMAQMSKHSKEMLALANAASKAKSDFLSRMSHEIRTPMNAIIGMTQIAGKTEDLGKVKECVGKISNASRHLLALINDILDMSKIEANKLELVSEEFNLKKALENIASVVSVKIEEKDLTLDLSVDKILPQIVIGDELRFSQVITNLLGNAIKFTSPKGHIWLEAKALEVSDKACEIQINVKDDGIGVPADKQAKLFQAFEQADGSTSRHFGGTGLGLSISKHIVEMMGGKIWIESAFGKGSTFSFTAKLKCGERSVLSTADAPIMHQENNDFSKNRILLVEDIDINREIVISLLEDTHIKIDSAENGEEACEMYAAHPERYDLIIMDLQMPVMDGLEATRKIRAMAFKNSKTIPIIAMTANAFKEDVDSSKRAGMTDHVAKPVDFTILLGKLRRYLPKRTDAS